MRNGYSNKIIIYVAVLVMLVSALLPLQSYADEQFDAVIEIENKTVHRGQTFQVEINLKENKGLISLLLQVEYDSEKFTLINAVRGDALDSLTYTTTNTETEQGFAVRPFYFLWDGREQDTTNGTLMTLVFESKISSDTGDYPITLSYDAENTRSQYGVPATVDIKQGVVTLTKGEYGAVYKNYDGTVLFEKDYNENDIPSYVGATPTRTEDEKYSYVFNKFVGEVSDNQNEIVYIADFKKVPQVYQVFLYVSGEYFDAFECEYGSTVKLKQPPIEKNYTFDGWYTDENFTVEYSALFMGAEDLRLYGRYKYNVREDNVPVITLSTVSVIDGVATVDAVITENPGFAGLVLTLDYDRSALEFIGFEESKIYENLQFDHTNSVTVNPYKFYWESVENDFKTGKLLTLKFKVNADVPAGVYDVTFTYDEKTDATFFTEGRELWYTKVVINGCKVPIGERFDWHENIESNDVDISVHSDIGMPVDVVLEINLVTTETKVTDENIKLVAGEDMNLLSAYTITLKRNGVTVNPSGNLTIRIKLNEEQMKSPKLSLYYVDDDGNMTAHDSWIEDNELVFVTDHLSEWIIVAKAVSSTLVIGKTARAEIIIPLLLLVIALSAYVLILLAKSRQRKLDTKLLVNSTNKED